MSCKLELKELSQVNNVNNNFSYPWTHYYIKEGENVTSISPNSKSPSTVCQISPNLPDGLIFNKNTCSIEGKPSINSPMTKYLIKNSLSQIFELNIQVTKSPSKLVFDNQEYKFKVGDIVNLPPKLSGGTISSCTINPKLPSGLVIDYLNCTISGQANNLLPSTNFTILSTTLDGTTPITSTTNISMSIIKKPILELSKTEYQVEVNTDFNEFQFTNLGSEIDNCELSPELPNGLVFNKNTCIISGKPTNVSASKEYTLTTNNFAGTSSVKFKLVVGRYSGLRSWQVALIINENDPYSVEIGEYYKLMRKIPNENIIKVKTSTKVSLNRNEFQALKSDIDTKLKNNNIQAMAIAWTSPSRVECNSITSALSRGFMPGPCDGGGQYPTCSFAETSKMYNSTTKLPLNDHGFRPSMLLAGKTISDAKKMIDNGVKSDGTQPSGSAYIMNTSDGTRSLRAKNFPTMNLGYALSDKINAEIVNANFVTDKEDALFYFQGIQKVENLDKNKYPPGAVADHLTSYGGMLTDSGQMSILEFIANGATGSFGTVSEPCAYPEKFPNPTTMIKKYTEGDALIMAYWKSISQTFQGVFVGEPMATPWAKFVRP